MHNIKTYLVKAFSKNPNQGNSAGVILNADALTEKQMKDISRQLGFSESAFVSRSTKGDYKVRFFSPNQEVDLCGHATIATFHVIKQKIEGALQKRYFIQETKAGLLPVECLDDGLIVMTQSAPQFSDYIPDRKEISQLLHIPEEELLAYPLCIVSTGTPKLLVPVRSLKTLFKITPNLKSIIAFCRKSGARGIYPFTSETKESGSDFHARQFNPLAGINEDPITGIAAGALGAYVKHFKLSQKDTFIVEQGYILNKPGKIFVDISDGIKVGGYAVIFGEKNILLKES